MDIPAAVARQLRYYVYAYVDPADGRILYVGKGKGRRGISHLRPSAAPHIRKALLQLTKTGRAPRIDILAHGLRGSQAALRIEAAVIDALGKDRLANQVRGWRAAHFGRVPLQDLVATKLRRPVEVDVSAILVRVNQLYRPDMTPEGLYDATRGVWRLGPKRHSAKYALAVFEGIVREVYEIKQWFSAGTTFSSRGHFGVRSEGRWEFIGRLAPQKIRGRYVDRFVGHYFKRGNQNPVVYVNLNRSRKRGL